MPRRYVSPDEISIREEFDLVPPGWEFSANFNVAPLKPAPVIRVVEDQPDPVLLRWGFGEASFSIPSESLALATVERSVLATAQRCIVPAMGFYEWRVAPDGTRKPFYVQVEDQAVFGMAGLWQGESFALITVPANALLAQIDLADSRMPAILEREQRDVWLYGGIAAACAAVAAYPAERMVAYAVSRRIDSLADNDEKLIEPLSTDVD